MKHPCPHCNFKGKSERSLQGHINRAHGKAGTAPVRGKAVRLTPARQKAVTPASPTVVVEVPDQPGMFLIMVPAGRKTKMYLGPEVDFAVRKVTP